MVSFFHRTSHCAIRILQNEKVRAKKLCIASLPGNPFVKENQVVVSHPLLSIRKPQWTRINLVITNITRNKPLFFTED